MSNTNVITIEKNIPIPNLTWGTQAVKYSFVNRMEMGDSFYINGVTPDFLPATVRSYMYKLNSETKKKYTIRTIEGPAANPNAIRVWRTK